MTETMMVVDTADLVGLLTDALKTAGTDGFPSVEGVLLHADTKQDRAVLVATSTNRYVLGQGHIPANGELHRVFLCTDTVKQVIAALKVSRKSSAPCEIRSDGETVVFAQSALTGFAGISVRVAADKDNFVKKTAVLLDHPEEPGEERLFRVSNRWLSAVVQVANRRGEALTIHAGGTSKQVVVTIGESYRAVVIPIRFTDAKVAPIFNVDALVTAEAKMKAAA